MLSLDRWCLILQLLPLEVLELERVFCAMLVHCKITKFREINFKILARILATPRILSRVKRAENLEFCVWCGIVANIEHILP